MLTQWILHPVQSFHRYKEQQDASRVILDVLWSVAHSMYRECQKGNCREAHKNLIETLKLLESRYV